MRRLSLGVGLLATAAVAVSLTVGAQPAAANAHATRTPIKHFITLMQENHSFDNYFGTYPGADGIPRGTCMPRDPDRPSRGCVEPFGLGGRAILDLDHNRKTFKTQLNGGAMNGFVKAFEDRGPLAETAMGHYDDRDIPYYWNVADEYVLFDRFFTSSSAGSVTNHLYWIAGAPGVTSLKREGIPTEGWGDLETIFDRLEKSGVSWKFYIQNYDPAVTYRNVTADDKGAQVVWAPLLAFNRFLDNPKLLSKIVDLNEYFDDLARGTLPAVSYIVPSGASEHPPGSIRAGERFVRTLINALQASDTWSSSAFMWTYDDWGGWYDHVRPPRVDRFGYGFRAPALLVSAYARRGHVDGTELDFTSMLKFIEHNWRLRPLARRDARANNFLSAFDFSQPPRKPVHLDRERGEQVREKQKTEPVYIAYAVAVAVPLLLISLASLTSRRRARNADTDEEEGSVP
jgi:phospholipase C